jgi:hypothetical protein
MAGIGFLYTFFTALGVCLIGTGLALQVLYIERYEETSDWSYAQIGSLTLNTLVVCYIMFMMMFYRPFNDSLSVALSSMALLMGLSLEMYSTQLETTNSLKVFMYFLGGFNALVRLYLLISVRCDKPLTTVSQLIEAVPQVAKNIGKPVQDVVKDIGAQASNVDFGNVYNKFLDILRKADITDEEKLKRNNDFRALWGKTPLEPKTQGGRRRR